MHALIENNVVTALRNAPSGGAWEDGEWLDFTDPTVLSEWEARHGWVPVTETPQPKDTQPSPRLTDKVDNCVSVRQWAYPSRGSSTGPTS